MKSPYQEKFGYPMPRTAGKVKPYMAAWIQTLLDTRHLCTGNEQCQRDCDASPKGGSPGFVKVLNDKQLFIPDVAGNKLFHGYGNIESNPKAG